MFGAHKHAFINRNACDERIDGFFLSLNSQWKILGARYFVVKIGCSRFHFPCYNFLLPEFFPARNGKSFLINQMLFLEHWKNSQHEIFFLFVGIVFSINVRSFSILLAKILRLRSGRWTRRASEWKISKRIRMLGPEYCNRQILHRWKYWAGKICIQPLFISKMWLWHSSTMQNIAFQKM